jgi:hypothetical protein
VTTSVTVRAIYHCSLERAFKTPILCDVSKIHTGFVFMPKVTHCTDDEHWGKPGYGKKVFAAKSFFQKGGWISSDTVIERIENRYWKIEVSNFKTWFLGFTKFVGEWQTTPLDNNKIQITYTYTLHFFPAILYPLNWLFTKIFWRLYMKRVIRNIRVLIDKEEPYLFE